MSPSARPATIQQLDPLGTLDGRPVVLVSAFVIAVIGAVMTATNLDAVAHPLLAGAGLPLIGLASVLLVLATSPLRAPLSAEMHTLIIGLLVVVYALNSASLETSNSLVTAHWAPLLIGIACMALALYRPVGELITVGVAASIFTGLIAFAEYSAMSRDVPATLVVLATMTPVLTMSLGGSAFAHSLARAHRRWEFRVRRSALRLLEREQESVARSVQQDRVTILNRDVVPLLTELTERGIISPEDRFRAAEYSESIRALMVTELNRSWLESLVANSFDHLDDGERVQDPHRLAAAMTPSQKAALRAAVLAVASGRELDASSVRLVIEKTAQGATIVVTSTVASSEASWRGSLAPYFAVLRVVFTGLRITYRSPTLIVRFTYDTP